MLKSKTFLGIDFGAGTLKAAEFAPADGGGIRLTKFAVKALGLAGSQDAARDSAVILDRSHLGRFYVTGDRAGEVLARVLGLSPATVTRLYAGEYQLDAGRKEWEFGLLLVRLFRNLDAIVADETSARAWLGSDNRGLGGRPIDLISQTEGLVRVVHYLDASRAAV